MDVGLPRLATVQDGVVTGLAEGSAVITAAYGEAGVSYRIQFVAHFSVMTLPSVMRILEEKAFCGGIPLEAAALPHGLTSIGARAFADCKNLKIISIPASVAEIGADALQTVPACGFIASTAALRTNMRLPTASPSSRTDPHRPFRTQAEGAFALRL